MDREIASKAGLPLPRDRSKRVRRMYSLLQDASADSRVKDRRWALSESEADSRLDLTRSASSASAPGKNRAKAMRQAGGVVTSL